MKPNTDRQANVSTLALLVCWAFLAAALPTTAAKATEPASPTGCPEGDPCDDGNPCTLNDSCNNIGVCVGGPPPPALRYCAFTAPHVIEIPSGPGAAMPYPSSLVVAGGTTVCKVTMDFEGVTHTNPDDIDMLLVGPAGQNAKIWSDVGGSQDVFGPSIRLDDNASQSIPDGGPLFTEDPTATLGGGTYKPTDVNDGPDNFPAPAPLPMGGSAFAVFKGTNPNGTWSLWVADDRAGDSGSLQRWCLKISFLCNADSQCADSDACTIDTCVNGVCSNAYEEAPPAEVSGLKIGADKQTISWLPILGAYSYDVVSGSLSGLPVGASAEFCFDEVSGTSIVDAAPLAPGTGSWYLARATNCWDAGTFGSRSDGTPRVTGTCP